MHFKKTLIDILVLYKNEYKPKKLSITRVLAYYNNNNDINYLLKNIKLYQKYKENI